MRTTPASPNVNVGAIFTVVQTGHHNFEIRGKGGRQGEVKNCVEDDEGEDGLGDARF